jgi:hypothetical protein
MIPLRAWLVPLFAVAILIAMGIRARAADLPPGMDCVMVRTYVAQHGKARALAWAIEQGYGWREIRAAKRCQRVLWHSFPHP